MSELSMPIQTWYEERDNVISLARHLTENGTLETADKVLEFFEKPWKWTAEFDEWHIEQMKG